MAGTITWQVGPKSKLVLYSTMCRERDGCYGVNVMDVTGGAFAFSLERIARQFVLKAMSCLDWCQMNTTLRIGTLRAAHHPSLTSFLSMSLMSSCSFSCIPLSLFFCSTSPALHSSLTVFLASLLLFFLIFHVPHCPWRSPPSLSQSFRFLIFVCLLPPKMVFASNVASSKDGSCFTCAHGLALARLCRSVCQPLFVSVCTSACPPASPYICLYLSLSIYIYIYIYLSLSLSLSFSVSQFLSLSLYLSISLSLYIYIFLSLSLSISLFLSFSLSDSVFSSLSLSLSRSLSLSLCLSQYLSLSISLSLSLSTSLRPLSLSFLVLFAPPVDHHSR